LADGTKKRSIDKGDTVALTLRKLTLDAVYATASSATGISQVGLRDRFAHLNPGMQRMNLGNMIRKALKESANA
jgi:colicin import membrane protein